ncbi:hypothetical protein NL480_29450, partial [Klebsiella pneumoniae]|nr:hypothetical protein [Klebsiella pneumoniae]
DPKPGINNWLEDELYQQYLSDRKAVDESWKQIFETNGHAVHTNGTTVIPAPAANGHLDPTPARVAPAAPPPPPSTGDNV